MSRPFNASTDTLQNITNSLSKISKFKNLELFGTRKARYPQVNKNTFKKLINSRYEEIKKKYNNNVTSSTNLKKLKELQVGILLNLNLNSNHYKELKAALNSKIAKIASSQPVNKWQLTNDRYQQIKNQISLTTNISSLKNIQKGLNKYSNSRNLSRIINNTIFRIEDNAKYSKLLGGQHVINSRTLSQRIQRAKNMKELNIISSELKPTNTNLKQMITSRRGVLLSMRPIRGVGGLGPLKIPRIH
jgi:hypothetical protein